MYGNPFGQISSLWGKVGRLKETNLFSEKMKFYFLPCNVHKNSEPSTMGRIVSGKWLQAETLCEQMV